MCLVTAGPLPSPLALAVRTIVSGALALRERLDRRAAAPAGLAAALVHVQALAKVARRAVRAQVIAQRRAPGADGELEHRAYRAHQAPGLQPRQRGGAAL